MKTITDSNANQSKSSELELLVSYRRHGGNNSYTKLINAMKKHVDDMVDELIRNGQVEESLRDDLIQVGIIGLIIGLRRFKVSNIVRLSSYIKPFIRAEISKYLESQDALIMFSDVGWYDEDGHDFGWADVMDDDIREEYIRSAHDNEVRAILTNHDMGKQDALKILQWKYEDDSIVNQYEDDQSCLAQESTIPTAEELLTGDRSYEKRLVNNAIDQLLHFQKMVISTIYFSEDDVTIAATARKFSTDVQAIKRVHDSAMKTIRREIFIHDTGEI
jgi:RNA polymerase sigma factor (sigma-70 family)